MARGDVPLHPEFGLNPTVPICFWCGESKNEVALLGNKYKGQAPAKMLLDYNPCEACAEKLAQGIHCIEVVSKEKSQFPPFAKDGALSYMAPTGNWAVVAFEAAERVFGSRAEEVTKAGKCILEHELYVVMFGDANAEG